MIVAIYSATSEGMIFYKCKIEIKSALDRLLGQEISEVISKPLFDCLICMSSFWTLALLLLVYDIEIISFGLIIKTILIVAGLNTIISKYINEDN